MKGIPSFLLLVLSLIVYTNQFHLPDPDPSLSGPKLFNFQDQWISIASDPFANTKLRPIPPVNENWKDPNTIIFVTLPHYRDPRCATTVKNLLTKAKHPHRLRFGIIQQRHTEEDFFKCVDDVMADLKGKRDVSGHPLLPDDHQFRLIEFTHQESYGPNFARSFVSQLLREEDEFCLSLDAHSDVIQGWDEELLTTWAATENEFAILSTQPPDISQLQEGSHGKVPHLCQATVDSRGVIVNLPPTLVSDLDRPLLSPLYSEAFAFSRCHAVKKVPNDPFLQMIYDGDEFARFIRLWTKGYDVYTPHKVIVAHDYHHKLPVIRATNKEINPMEWNHHGAMKKDIIRDLYDRSMHRLLHLYGRAFLTDSSAFLEDDAMIAEMVKMDRYGLLTSHPSSTTGDSNGEVVMQRDLFDLMKFTGINTIKREIFADRCKALEWIPSYSTSSAEKKVNPWRDEGNVFGASASEIIRSNDHNIPFPSSSSGQGGGGGVELKFFPLDSYTQRPTSGAETVTTATADQPLPPQGEGAAAEAVVDPIIAVAAGEEPHKVIAEHLVPSEDAHRGGELWFIFQWLDSRIELVINQIDRELGYGHGHAVMRVVLLSFPLVCMLFGFAVYLLLTDEQRLRFFGFSGSPSLFTSNSANARTAYKLK